MHSYWVFWIQNMASWWCTNYTKLFCNYILHMILNNWRALLVWFCGGFSLPCPRLFLFFLVDLYNFSVSYLKRIHVCWVIFRLIITIFFRVCLVEVVIKGKHRLLSIGLFFIFIIVFIVYGYFWLWCSRYMAFLNVLHYPLSC